MVDLPKGGNTAVEGPMVRSVLRTALAPGEIDVCAVLLNASRLARSDQDFVYFNQPRSGCGSTRLLSPVEVEIDLRQIPVDVETIVVAAALDDGVAGHVAGHGGGGVTVHDGLTTITHTFTGLSTERCVIVAEIYRRAGGWKIRAVSQGFDDLAGLIAVFGVHAVNDTDSASDSDSSPPPTLQPEPAPGPPAQPGPAGRPEPSTSGPSPQEIHEIIDRVRAGAVTRRPSASRRRPRSAWGDNPPRRGSMPAAQYKALRHADAERRTGELREQHWQIQQLLQQLPLRDLSVPGLLGLLDASVPSPARWRLFGRREQTPAVAPSTTWGLALRALARRAGTVGDQEAIEAWMWLIVAAMDLQPSFGHVEHICLHPTDGKIVLDIDLPDRALIPATSEIRYRPGTDRLEHLPTIPRDRARLLQTLFGAALLAHTHSLAEAVVAARLPGDTVLIANGWESARDPATGLPARLCRASMATSARDLRGIDLAELDPVACLRRFAGRLDEDGQVTPHATRSAAAVPEREVDLRSIDPFAFERLVTQLAEAMGYVAYQTPLSGDHGVDVFVESNDTLAGGKIVISAKRYNSTVGPDHVRALATVVGDQGAIKGILITTSRFGPESYRIAETRPIDLIDGQQLREWLHRYLGITGT